MIRSSNIVTCAKNRFTIAISSQFRRSNRSLSNDVVIRPMEDRDVDAADTTLRAAFNDLLGQDLFGDMDYIRTRSKYNTAAFVAELNDEIIGSHFTWSWGSFQGRGPMSISPKYQSMKVSNLLIDAVFQNISTNPSLRSSGLFTFPHSPKHLYLYGKKGYKPRYLTPVLMKTKTEFVSNLKSEKYEYGLVDDKININQTDDIIKKCKKLTNDVHDGLDLSIEINAVLDLGLGFIVFVRNKMNHNDDIDGFAVVHYGKGTEAGSNKSFIKFAVSKDETSFQELLNTIEKCVIDIGDIDVITGGMNLGRSKAFDIMFNKCKYKYSPLIGVALERNSDQFINDEYQGYNKSDVFIIDDWR